jgi:hypothetical protein
MFFFWFGSTQNHSELKVGGIRGSSRVALFMACIAHKRESDVCGRMADEVGTVIKPSMTVFAATELVRRHGMR